MKTIVKVEGSLAELTPEGWMSERPEIERFCNFAVTSGSGYRWNVNPHKASVERLLEACQEWRMKVEVISIADHSRPLTDPDCPEALF